MMTRAKMIALALALLGTGNAGAAFLDGRQLLEYCTGGGKQGAKVCEGYVAGVVDSRLELHDREMLEKKFCLPVNVDLGQVVQVVVNYLFDHPDELEYTANSTVYVALQGAFPCA